MSLERPQMAHAVRNFLTNFRGAIGLCNLKIGPQLVHYRQKRHCLAEGQTLPLQPGHRVARRRQTATELKNVA